MPAGGRQPLGAPCQVGFYPFLPTAPPAARSAQDPFPAKVTHHKALQEFHHLFCARPPQDRDPLGFRSTAEAVAATKVAAAADVGQLP